MKVIQYELFGSIGFLVAAAGLVVGSVFISPDLALADKPIKRNFRLSDGLKDLPQNVPTNTKLDADSQQSQWRRVEKSRLFRDTSPGVSSYIPNQKRDGFGNIIPRLPYENPNSFKTYQFEQ
jgi:hypothetical protein